MDTFHDVRLPLRLGFGASGGPERRTEIIELASGKEVRNARWAGARRRWDLAGAVSDMAALSELAAFFEARRGRLHGFRFRDFTDFSSGLAGQAVTASDQLIGTGDGGTLTFQLSKTNGEVVRVISRPVDGSVVIALDGVQQVSGWNVNLTTGQVVFDSAPGIGVSVSAGFLFDCAVRFDTDRLDMTLESFAAGRVVSVPLVELV